MSKQSTRDELLDAGERVFLERGFHHAGIESILRATGVPKGSFYHYFESKEDFGLQVLNRFAECHNAILARYLEDTRLRPLQRLRLLAESWCQLLETRQCRNGCLVGNLSQELADQNEVFRLRLDEICRDWAALYAGCFREAQEAGEIPQNVDVGELAEFWLNSWQGSLLRAKTSRGTAPLRTFLNLMFGLVLQKEENRGA